MENDRFCRQGKCALKDQSVRSVFTNTQTKGNRDMVFLMLLLLLYGLSEAFLGYKLYKFWLGVCGFAVGGFFGALIGMLSGETAITVIAVVIVGILGAILNVVLWKIGIFVQCFVYGFLILGVPLLISQLPTDLSSGLRMGYNFVTTGNTGMNFATPIIVGLLGGIVLGIVGVILARPVLIITSSLVGGISCGVSICLMIGCFEPAIMILIALVVAALGIFVQFKTTGKKVVKTSSVQSESVQPLSAQPAAAQPLLTQPSAVQPSGAGVQVLEGLRDGGARLWSGIRQGTQAGIQKVVEYQQAESEKAAAKIGTMKLRELMDQVEAYLYGSRILAWCMPFTTVIMAVVLVLYMISGLIGGGIHWISLFHGLSNAFPLVLLIGLFCTIRREYLTALIGFSAVAVGNIGMGILALYWKQWSSGILTWLILSGVLIYVECRLYLQHRTKGIAVKMAPTAAVGQKADIFCPGCGQPIQTGIQFCSMCGTQIK